MQYLLREDAFPVSADSSVSPEGDAESSVEMQLFVCTTDSFDLGGLRDAPMQPHENDWTFIGYDICDGAMLSGLMNCGYEGRNALRAEWSQRLNQWHLFESLVDARNFCAMTEQRVPEHAPFRLVAVYVRPAANLVMHER